MWCTLKPRTVVNDCQLKTFLCNLEDETLPEESGRLGEQSDASRSMSSGGDESPTIWEDWGDESYHNEAENEAESSVSWMQECHMAVSPDAQVLIAARLSKLCFLHSKVNHDSSEVRDRFELDTKIEISEDYGVVTGLLCLPVASSQQTQIKIYDWLCGCVVTSLGYVLFYTDRGALILVQRFSTGNVRSIHFGPVVHGAQQLSILYSDCMVFIEGLSLYTALRAARSQAARGLSLDEISDLVELTFEKWKPNDCDLRHAYHCSTGPIRQSSIDQLISASLNGGFYARAIRPTPPLYATYCICATKPYLSFYWHEEGASSPALSDAIYGLADKVKSQIPSFMNIWGNSNPQSKSKPSPIDMRALQLAQRNGVWDDTRQGVHIYPSGVGGLVLVTDDLARVALVDISERRVVRIWKGYRDAECAWVQVKGKEDSSTKICPIVLFVVIFAPRRGIVEVWAAQCGNRVAAFNVDKGGRLLSPSTCHILGSNQTPSSMDSDDEQSNEYISVLFVSSNGIISRLIVPIHLALKDESISETHDSNIIEQLKRILEDKWKEESLNELKKVYCLLRQPAAMKKGAEMFLASKKMDVLSLGILLDVVIDSCQTSVSKRDSKEDIGRRSSSSNRHCHISLEMRMLLSHTLARKQLLNAYAILRMNSEKSEEIEVEQLDICQVLRLDLKTLESHMKPIECAHRLRLKKEKSCETLNKLTFAEFLACFDLTHLFSSMEGEFSVDQSSFLSFYLQEVCLNARSLGEMIYRSYLQNQTSLKFLERELFPQLGLPAQSLLHLLFVYWLGLDHTYSVYPPVLYALILHLVGNCKEEKWLPDVERILLESKAIPECLTLAIVLRAVLQTNVIEKNKASIESENEEKWGLIDMDIERWDVILQHFNALLWLNNLIDIKPESSNTLAQAISFQYLLDHGKGFYREIIARWVSCSFLPPKSLRNILDTKTDEFKGREDEDKWEVCLYHLHKFFPLSLKTDLVLCDCCMEQASLWDRDADRLDRFEHCLQLMDDIENHILKHGMAHILWDMFVARRIHKLTLLIEKVGKPPKDRVSRRDVGVSEGGLARFTKACTRLLSSMHKANSEFVDYSQILKFSFEDSIHSLFSTYFPLCKGAAISPLADLAAKKKCTNFLLVEIHRELSMVLNLMLTVQLSTRFRPMSLFDTKSRDALFKPLTEHPLLNLGTDVDELTQKQRLLFCSEILKNDAEDESDVVQQVMQLAAGWDGVHCQQLQNDLSRVRVVNLFAMGQDIQAHALMPAIGQREQLALELLELVGGRCNSLIQQLSELEGVENMVEINFSITQLASPKLLDWLKSVPLNVCLDNGKKLKEKLDSARGLLGQVEVLMPTSNPEFKTVTELDELLSNIHEFANKN